MGTSIACLIRRGFTKCVGCHRNLTDQLNIAKERVLRFIFLEISLIHFTLILVMHGGLGSQSLIKDNRANILKMEHFSRYNTIIIPKIIRLKVSTVKVVERSR